MKRESLYKNLPESPGVYLMKDAQGKILYIGKAGNLKRRVSSYFLRSYEYRIERLMREVKKISCKKTDTAVEALILESELIKKHKPPYNVREKDDKSFLYVEITKDEFPRVLLVRGKERLALSERQRVEGYGPFTSAGSIREALRIVRKIFPYSTHPSTSSGQASSRQVPSKSFPRYNSGYPKQSRMDINTSKSTKPTGTNSEHSDAFVAWDRDSRRRPCFEYQIGLCPGTCVGAISKTEYQKTIRHIKLFFEGKKGKITNILEREMRNASQKLEFEKAEKLRRQLFALRHIQDIALITDDSMEHGAWSTKQRVRIEGYDVSNISGTSAVGVMVVFYGDKPAKSEYRKFKIRTVHTPNDVGMLLEVLRRRFSRVAPKSAWELPQLVLVDGGKGQVRVAKEVIRKAGLSIPVLGIAKGPTRKKNEFIGKIPKDILQKTLIAVRDEAHRFAIAYHRKTARKNLMN